MFWKKKQHKTTYADLLCPKCKKWSNDIGGVASVKECGDYTEITCKNCNTITQWYLDIAPVPIRKE